MTTDKNRQDTISFEHAHAELEEIVRKIEIGDLSLEENLELFERGIALTRLCSSKLENARQKIEQLIGEDRIEAMQIE